MKRRDFLKKTAAGVAGLYLPLSLPNLKNMRIKSPNILLIESDSMDGRAMGCMGHPAALTPNLDRLADRGTLFTKAYCNSPQCVPSRSSMWSGRYTHHIEGWNNFKGIEQGTPTFLTYLNQANFVSKTIGKTDFLSGGHSLGSRLNGWVRSSNIPFKWKEAPQTTIYNKVNSKTETPSKNFEKDHTAVKNAINWLQQYEKNQQNPFMLYVGIRGPHPPFETTEYWWNKIDPSKVTLPVFEESLHPVMEYMSATKGCLGKISESDILNIRRTYRAMIAEVDNMIGQIIDAVDILGFSDNTYIIYISDHGEMAMEHRQWLKNALYEPSAHIPMIVSGPEIQKATANDNLVSLIDIFPTLMDMADITSPPKLDGNSLMNELTGAASQRPDWVLAQYHSNFQNTGSFMLRQGDWKYIKYMGYESQLFNVKDDPAEIHNLAQQRSDIANELDQKLYQLVDCDEVDARVKKYDKESFRNWLAEVGEETYQKTFAELVPDWNSQYDEQLKQWVFND